MTASPFHGEPIVQGIFQRANRRQVRGAERRDGGVAKPNRPNPTCSVLTLLWDAEGPRGLRRFGRRWRGAKAHLPVHGLIQCLAYRLIRPFA